MNLRGVWTNYGNLLVLPFRKRQQIALVFQQDDGFVRGFERKLLVCGDIGYFFRVSRIDVRILEQAGLKFHSENARDGTIHNRFRDFALMDLLDQARIAGYEGQLHIDAGVERVAGGRFVVAHDVMNGSQLADPEVVGHDRAIKAPFVTQDSIDQPFVAVRRNSVHLIIGRHHRSDVRLVHGGFERPQPIFSDDALGIIAGATLVPPSGWPWTAKCFAVAYTWALSSSGPVP